MGAELRRALFSTLAFAFALAGCGESFLTQTGGAGGADGGTGGGETASSGAGGMAGSGGTTGGTASTAGSGGAPCDDSDKDDDGYSECDGDCDDALPSVHPGAVELCGDGADQDCDGTSEAEPPCGGLGTFVSQKYGSVGATGTMADPVATIAEALANAALITAGGTPTAVVISEGSYVEDLVVVGPVSLLGGYDPEDWSLRDPAMFPTTIKNTKSEGLKLIGTAQPMTVDGLTVQGRNVSIGSGPSIAITIDGGAPILRNNVITGGEVTVGAGASVGVRVITETATGTEAALHENKIQAGTSTGGGSYGVSLEAGMMTVVLGSNEVSAGKGVESVALLVAAATGVHAAANVLQSRTAMGSAGVDSTSLGAWVKAGALTFEANIVNADQAFDPPKCFTPGAWCGGVRASVPGAVLVNNIVYGSASPASAALHLLEGDTGLSDVVVSSNLLVAAGAAEPQAKSTAVLLGSPMLSAGTTLVGRFRNNIFLGGLAEQTYGFYEQPFPGETVEPAALDHNLFYFPGAGQNTGILYLDWNGFAAVPITMIGDLPGDKANLFQNPLLLDGQHIDPNSPCISMGTDLDAPDADIDGDVRPQGAGYDIGPDELASPR